MVAFWENFIAIVAEFTMHQKITTYPTPGIPTNIWNEDRKNLRDSKCKVGKYLSKLKLLKLKLKVGR